MAIAVLKNVQMAVLTHVRERWIVCILATIWLTHLLMYVWLIPPWQHYDEPTHFEYAALIRVLGRLPSQDEYIPALRRAIALSMIETGFFHNRSISLPLPNLKSPNFSIGVNEAGNPPLYYILVALATIPVRAAPITTQLYAARLCSVALALVFFGTTYLLLRLLTGNHSLSRCWILTVLVLQPAFTDNMSSVNNDVLANLSAVLVLLSAVWFVRRPGWFKIVIGVVLIILAIDVKRTLIIYSLLLPLVWLLILPSRLKRWFLLLISAMVSGILIWLSLNPWPLADWNSSSSSTPGYVSTRLLQPFNHLSTRTNQLIKPQAGKAAFALMTNDNQSPLVLSQQLYPLQLNAVAGQTITLAAWMRADDETVALTPVLLVDNQVISRSISLKPTWQLITLTTKLPEQIHFLKVELRSPVAQRMVLYDSLALVIGDTTNLPEPNEPDGSFEAGLLEPTMPRNLLRNPGAERQVPPVLTALDLFGWYPRDPDSIMRALSTVFHPAWITAVYPQQALVLFQGFWGVFGWGNIRVHSYWFIPLGMLVTVSLFGVGRITWRCYRVSHAETPKQILVWKICLIAVVLGWGAALLRVHFQPFPGTMFWSFGRYTFVAIVPSMILFITGLCELLPFSFQGKAAVGTICFLIAFALHALSVASTAYT